ncbi:MAG: single-stranded DNA-binding protein [Deltaproteobacteria bacterium]|nr:single-stranded DNA-binding protein [Deltaproteobacteria bacterium]
MGRLSRSPELRRSPRGTAVCSFSLTVPGAQATGRGEKAEDLLVDVVVYGALAEHCHAALGLDTPVLVEGALVQRRWQGVGGISQSKYEVVAQTVRAIE